MNAGAGPRAGITRYTGSVGAEPETITRSPRSARLVVPALPWNLPIVLGVVAFLLVERAVPKRTSPRPRSA